MNCTLRNALTINLAITFIAAFGLQTTARSQDEVQMLLGNWVGDSICQVKNSPCHDEKAIYRITPAKEPGKVTIDLGKLVAGQAESMVVLDFKYDRMRKTLTCAYKHGVWEFTIKGNKMEGTLTTPEKIIYRRVSLKKEGPTQRAFAVLDEAGQTALCDDLEQLWTPHNQATDGTTLITSEYLKVIATRD